MSLSVFTGSVHIEMAVGISIMVLEFCILGVYSPGGKIPSRFHPSSSAQAHCVGAKSGSGKDPDCSPLRFQLGCRSRRWTEPRQGGIGEELIHPAHHKRRNAALRVVAGKLQN